MTVIALPTVRCKIPGCDRPWNKGRLLLCDAHEETALVELNSYRDDPDYPGDPPAAA